MLPPAWPGAFVRQSGYRYQRITPSTKPIAGAQMTVLAGSRPAHRWRRDPRAARGAVASRQSMTQRVSPRRAVHAPQMIWMRAVLGSSDVDLATTIVPDSASTGSLRDFLHLALSDHHRTGVAQTLRQSHAVPCLAAGGLASSPPGSPTESSPLGPLETRLDARCRVHLRPHLHGARHRLELFRLSNPIGMGKCNPGSDTASATLRLNRR